MLKIQIDLFLNLGLSFYKLNKILSIVIVVYELVYSLNTF